MLQNDAVERGVRTLVTITLRHKRVWSWFAVVAIVCLIIGTIFYTNTTNVFSPNQEGMPSNVVGVYLQAFLDFIAASVATAFGVFLALWFDRRGRKKGEKQKKIAFLESLRDDITDNLALVTLIKNQPISSLPSTLAAYINVNTSYWKGLRYENLYELGVRDIVRGVGGFYFFLGLFQRKTDNFYDYQYLTAQSSGPLSPVQGKILYQLKSELIMGGGYVLKNGSGLSEKLNKEIEKMKDQTQTQERKAVGVKPQSVRRYVWGLFTIAMLFLGGVLLCYYFYPPSFQLQVPKQNFGVGVTKGVGLDWPVTIGLDTQQDEPVLYLEAFIHPIPLPKPEEGPAFVMFVLPFHIRTIAEYTSSNDILHNWDEVNDDNGVGSLIYAQVSNDSMHFNSTVLVAELLVDRTFESSQRGVFTIVLPFGSGVGGSQFAEVSTLQEELKVSLTTIDSTDVYVTIQSSAMNVQGLPEPTSRNPYTRPTDNQTLNSVYWHLTQMQTLTLTYEDSAQVAFFTALLIIGSLCLGVVPSGILDWCEKLGSAT